MTPLDKLTRLPGMTTFLRPGITLEQLHTLAMALTDVLPAEELSDARAALGNRVAQRTG